MLKKINKILHYMAQHNIKAYQLDEVRHKFIPLFANLIISKKDIDQKYLDKNFEILLNEKKDSGRNGSNIIDQIQKLVRYTEEMELEEIFLSQSKFLRRNILPAVLSRKIETHDKWMNNFIKQIRDIALRLNNNEIYLRALPYQNEKNANEDLCSIIYRSKAHDKSRHLALSIIKNQLVRLNGETVYEIGSWDLLKDNYDSDVADNIINNYMDNGNSPSTIATSLHIGSYTKSSFLLLKSLSKKVEDFGNIPVYTREGKKTLRNSVEHEQKRNKKLEDLILLIVESEKQMLDKNIVIEKSSKQVSRL